MSEKSLGEILSELAGEHGVSVDKVSEATNVPKRYVVALFQDDIKNMPAAPYVRGYLSKIAVFLGTGNESLQEAYKRLDLKVAGKEDNLPINRFAVVKNRRGIIWITVVSLAIVIFLGVRLNSLLGIPTVEVNIPAKVDDRDYVETRDQTIVIEGKVASKDSVIINKEPIPTDRNGQFSKEVILDKGINTFEITVKRFLGRETTIIRKVFRIVDEVQEQIPEQQVEEQTIPQGESAQ